MLSLSFFLLSILLIFLFTPFLYLYYNMPNRQKRYLFPYFSIKLY
nr:MAG TPA: hypothetical protein [Caudoviricetes sp.]